MDKRKLSPDTQAIRDFWENWTEPEPRFLTCPKCGRKILDDGWSRFCCEDAEGHFHEMEQISGLYAEDEPEEVPDA